ncbi:MAG: D-alanine--D-alanine ligase [Propionibacteriaceae bacterium]|jgi:D-alanine-D-alanine ligase|nr:D-alanine--D-alanine ligase [Propionibacteriaceae bacterium]
MTEQDTVVVLAGGLSHERDISLRSGRRVAQALRDQGLDVVESDVNSGLVELLRSLDNPVAFPTLHGGVGEDGGLQQALALLRVPYVGSSPTACRRAFNKAICGPLVAAGGLPVPQSAVLPHDMFRELGARQLVEALAERIGFPMMVKPVRSGSALGAAKVEAPGGIPGAMVSAYSYGDVNIIEEFIAGIEVAVTVLDLGDGPKALPAVQIEPNSGVYDYTARYTAGATRFITPADIPAEQAQACAEMAIRAHQILGLGDISRSDIIIRDGQPVFIEANTAPGMTETSLAPLAVQAAGLDFGDICAQLVRIAKARL